MTASAGYAAQLGISAAAVPIAGERFEFARCMLGAHESIIDANGIIGSRSRDIERVRNGLVHVNGQIEMEPTAAEWALLLPWLLGAGPTGAGPLFAYGLADQMPLKYVVVDKVAKVFTYNGCAVNKFTLSGAQGQPLKCVIEVIGLGETPAAAGTFPALVIDLTTAPFVFHDGVITLGGTATLMKSWEISVDNHIDAERFFNSVTLAGTLALDRTTTFKASIAYDSVLGQAIYGTGIGGAIIDISNTNGNQHLNIAMPAVSFPKQGIDVPGRVEEMLEINGVAYRKALASELAMACDATP
jgi:hypothetical protein